MNVLYSLWIFLLYFFLCQTYKPPDSIFLVFMMDQTGSRSENILTEVTHYAVKKISQEILPNITVNYTILDSKSATSVIQPLLEAVKAPLPIRCLIGPNTSSQMKQAVAEVKFKNNLIFSYAATSSKIDGGEHFVRVIPSDQIQVKAGVSFISWLFNGSSDNKMIGVVSSKDEYGKDVLSSLETECALAHIQIGINLELEPTEFDLTFNMITRLEGLSVIYVVVIYPLSEKILEYAYLNNMNGPEYLWIFTEAAVSQLTPFLAAIKRFQIANWVATVPPDDHPLYDMENKTLLSASKNVYSIYLYDTFLVFATAIRTLIEKQQLTNGSDFSKIKDTILHMNIEGLSGDLWFDVDGERKSEYYFINGWNDENDHYNIAAIYNSSLD